MKNIIWQTVGQIVGLVLGILVIMVAALGLNRTLIIQDHETLPPQTRLDFGTKFITTEDLEKLAQASEFSQIQPKNSWLPLAQAATIKLNIIRFVADDLDLKTFNEALAMGLLPNIKKYIVDPGVTFDNSFVGGISACCPSRANLDTGQYWQNNHVLTNDPPSGGVGNLAEATALPVWLKNAGYLSTHIGKYYNGFGTDPSKPVSSPYNPQHVPPGWTTTQLLVDPSTYTAYDHIFSSNGTLNDDRPLGNTPQNYPLNDLRAWNYHTDMITLRALLWMKAISPLHMPMFLSLNPAAPHLQFVSRDPGAAPIIMCTPGSQGYAGWGIASEAAPKYANTLTSSIVLPQSPSFNEADPTLSKKPLWVRQRPAMTSDDIACINAQYRRHLEVLQSIDDQVGLVGSYLTQLGLINQTVLIFTSDNGYLRGDHRLLEKLAPYEESIRVPLIISGPGFPAHHVSQMVNAADIAPTIAELASATPLVTVDGRSLVPLLKGQTPTTWRNAMLICGFVAASNDGSQIPAGWWVPHAPFCGVRMASPARLWTHYMATSTEPANTELYDLDIDSAELVNRNNDPAYALDAQKLDALIQPLAGCSGQTCRNLEDQARIP